MKKIVIQNQPPIFIDIEQMLNKLENEYQKNNPEEMKRRLSNSVDEKTLDMFQVTAAIMQDKPTKLITQFMKDYIIRNKVEVNEFLKLYYKNENN